MLGFAALDAPLDAEMLAALGVGGLQVAQRLAAAAEQRPAVQFALVVQGDDDSLDVRGLLVQMEHGGDDPLSPFLVKPIH